MQSVYSAVNLYLLCRKRSALPAQAHFLPPVPGWVNCTFPVTFKQAKNTHVTPGFRQGGKALQISPGTLRIAAQQGYSRAAF